MSELNCRFAKNLNIVIQIVLTSEDVKTNDGSTPPKTKSVNNDSLSPIIYSDDSPDINTVDMLNCP